MCVSLLLSCTPLRLASINLSVFGGFYVSTLAFVRPFLADTTYIFCHSHSVSIFSIVVSRISIYNFPLSSLRFSTSSSLLSIFFTVCYFSGSIFLYAHLPLLWWHWVEIWIWLLNNCEICFNILRMQMSWFIHWSRRQAKNTVDLMKVSIECICLSHETSSYFR